MAPRPSMTNWSDLVFQPLRAIGYLVALVAALLVLVTLGWILGQRFRSHWADYCSKLFLGIANALAVWVRTVVTAVGRTLAWLSLHTWNGARAGASVSASAMANRPRLWLTIALFAIVLVAAALLYLATTHQW